MTAPPEPWRPRWHFSARRGWINDPNGLILHEGEYHLFFQHNPFGNEWGHMSWGHAVSTDLLSWRELPVAIAEDERVSIYSGSTVIQHDRMVAIYTGCLRRPEGGQAQELAFSSDRGRSFVKHPGNPVLDLGLRDFRDPKVFWHAPTQRWVMVVVVPDDRCAKFFASTDLLAWQWLSDFTAPFAGQGIWECPDLLPLRSAEGDDVWLFKVDVFGGHPSGDTGARIVFGHFDGTRFTPESESAPQWADWGADFYAALSFAGLPTPRAVWLAWMNCHRCAKHLPTSPFRGAMTVPRELSVRRGATGWQLLQQPVPELLALRGAVREHAAVRVHDGDVPWHDDGATLDIELRIDATNAAECGLVLREAADGSERTLVGHDAARGVVFVDRSQAGFAPPNDTLWPRRREAPAPAPRPDAPLRLRVLVDTASVEVFIGDGHATLTEQILPRADSTGLRLFSRGGTTRFGATRVWPLRPAEMG